MKRRKPLAPGDTMKEMQRTAKIRKQIEDERQRHRAALADFSRQRQKATLRESPAEISIELARISAKEIDENRRHRAKIQTLQSRIYKKS